MSEPCKTCQGTEHLITIRQDAGVVTHCLECHQPGTVTPEQFAKALDRIDDLERQVVRLLAKIPGGDGGLSESERAFHEHREEWVKKSRDRDQHRRGREEG